MKRHAAEASTVAFFALVPLLMAENRPNFKCQAFPVISGCGSAYSCTSWDDYICDDDISVSHSKKGENISCRACITAAGENCDQELKNCFRETYYNNTVCNNFCNIFYTQTDGCSPPL